MSTETRVAPAGKGAETTARNGAGSGGQPRAGEAQNLTAARVASLLKSEFAAAPGGAANGEEVQPRGGTAGRTPDLVQGPKSKVQESEQDREARLEKERKESEAFELQQRAEEAGRSVEEQQAFEEAEATGAAANAPEGAEEAGAEPEAGAEEGATEVPQALEQAIHEWEESGGGELPPALQGLVDRRVNKLTARAKTAEGRVEELEAELASAKSGTPGTASLPELPDAKTFETQYGAAKNFVSEVRAYFEDAADDEEKARVERYMESERLDAKGLKRKMLKVSEWLTDEAPQLRLAVQQEGQKRQQHIEQEKVASAKAESHFPWLKSKTGQEWKDTQEVLKVFPDLARRTPLHQLVMGVYVLGLQQARKLYPDTFRIPGSNGSNGKGNGVKAGKAPARTPAAGGAAAPRGAVRTTGKDAQEEAARQRFNANPTREGVTELLKAGFKAR